MNCGYECQHEYMNNGVCERCGYEDPTAGKPTLTFNGMELDLDDDEAVEAFNEEHPEMTIKKDIFNGDDHVVMNLNNANINIEIDEDAADIDEITTGIKYNGSTPLVVNLNGESNINLGDAVNAVGIMASGELTLTGSGTLNINTTENAKIDQFVGIYASDVNTYSNWLLDLLKMDFEMSGIDDLAFRGSININGTAAVMSTGIYATNSMMMTAGDVNINVACDIDELDYGFSVGLLATDKILFWDNKVNIKSASIGIVLGNIFTEAKPQVPMLASHKAGNHQSQLMAKAKDGMKNLNTQDFLTEVFETSSSDVVIEASLAPIGCTIEGARWSCATIIGGTAYIELGTSKEDAETYVVDNDFYSYLNILNIGDTMGKSYLHIYEVGEATTDFKLYDNATQRDQYLDKDFGGYRSYSELLNTLNMPVYLNITLNRTFEDDGWYTLCLPFDLDVASSPFSKAARLTGITFGDVVTFSTVDKMLAGVPYLVKVNQKVVNPAFENVKVVGCNASYDKVMAEYDMAFVFNGCYDPVTILSADVNLPLGYVMGLGSGNTINPITYGTTVRGFRGFFTLYQTYNNLAGSYPQTSPSQLQAKTLTFTVDGENEGVVTAIDREINANVNTGNGATYNVMGQRVKADTKGIVIRNGHTFINK